MTLNAFRFTVCLVVSIVTLCLLGLTIRAFVSYSSDTNAQMDALRLRVTAAESAIALYSGDAADPYVQTSFTRAIE